MGGTWSGEERHPLPTRLGSLQAVVIARALRSWNFQPQRADAYHASALLAMVAKSPEGVNRLHALLRRRLIARYNGVRRHS